MRSAEAAPQAPVSPSNEVLEAELNDNSSDVPMDEFEAEYSTETPHNSSDIQPATAPDLYTSSATMLRSSAERVAALLEKLSAGKDARQEARAEKMETAKETVVKAGRGALKGAKNTGLFTLGMSVLTVELVADSSVQVRGKVMEIAMKARQRFAERAAYREENRRNRESQDNAFASYEPNVQYSQDYTEALDMNAQKKADQEYAEMSYGPNVRYSQDHAEAYDINEQKKADQETAFDSYESNIAYSEDHAEAREDDERFNKLRKLRERREAALAHKARRKEMRGNIRDKSSELYGRAKSGAKRFGHAALKMIKRTAAAGRAAASAAVGAGKEAWAQSA
ncbi:MAG: hypothetical protein JWP06_81 [Candidatus Saccharibacteria bacterium]|nr:hypothetical protein [Candidatus Saccharibacteria bacterium]